MRFAFQVLVLLMLATTDAAAARATANHMSTTRMSDRTYVRLSDWGRARGFAVRWTAPGKTLLLTNRVAQMRFNVDPHLDRTKAFINGVEVSLLFPITYQNGTAYISQLDADKTLTPILSPTSGSKITTICLDPGHGGKDPGFRVGSNEEQKYTLLLAQAVREQLVREGFKVVLTRDSDRFVDLTTRSVMARQRGADLFVSLHFNATETSRNEVQGAETYCCTPAGATSSNSGGEGNTSWVNGNRYDARNVFLAHQIQKAIVRNVHAEDRGVKRARFAVLREASMPAVLIEAGFMSHPDEGKRIYDPAYRRQLARAIAEGIIAYKRIVNG